MGCKKVTYYECGYLDELKEPYSQKLCKFFEGKDECDFFDHSGACTCEEAIKEADGLSVTFDPKRADEEERKTVEEVLGLPGYSMEAQVSPVTRYGLYLTLTFPKPLAEEEVTCVGEAIKQAIRRELGIEIS